MAKVINKKTHTNCLPENLICIIEHAICKSCFLNLKSELKKVEKKTKKKIIDRDIIAKYYDRCIRNEANHAIFMLIRKNHQPFFSFF